MIFGKVRVWDEACLKPRARVTRLLPVWHGCMLDARGLDFLKWNLTSSHWRAFIAVYTTNLPGFVCHTWIIPMWHASFLCVVSHSSIAARITQSPSLRDMTHLRLWRDFNNCIVSMQLSVPMHVLTDRQGPQNAGLFCKRDPTQCRVNAAHNAVENQFLEIYMGLLFLTALATRLVIKEAKVQKCTYIYMDMHRYRYMCHTTFQSYNAFVLTQSQYKCNTQCW